MFKFLVRPKPSGDLIRSSLFNEQTFYGSFAKDLRCAKKRVIIESPYLTERRALQFQKLLKKLVKQGVKITIYTRYPKCHDKLLEIQAWKAIRVFNSSGVRVRSYRDMRHRKLAMIDDDILWEGSLNIFSQCNSLEIMRRTKSTILCKQMLRFTGIDRWFW